MNRRFAALVLAIFFVALGPVAIDCVYGQEDTNPTQKPNPVTAGNPEAQISPEARAVVLKGSELLDAKNYKEAIKAFTAAARRHPENGQFRHLLGYAFAQDKQFGPAWIQLRQAVRLNPFYEPGVRHFLSLWSDFDKKGVLTIGAPKSEIVRLIGQPDRSSGDESRSTIEYGFMQLHFVKDRLYAVIDPRGMKAGSTTPADIMQIDFDDKERWRLGYRAINKLQSLTEYVLKEESVQKWTEIYTVQRLYRLAATTTPKKMAANLEQQLRKLNPDIDFQMLTQDDNDVTFHWREKKTKDREAQHEIVRLVSGAKDIHRLAYTRKVAQIPTEEAQAWFKLIRGAKLKPAEAPATTSIPAEPATTSAPVE